MKTIASLDPEDVQSYPRPPALERVALPVRVVLGGETIAETTHALRICETHHAPTYYLPPDSIRPGALRPAEGQSFCEWKGRAGYWTVSGGTEVRPRAAWSYPEPSPVFAPLKDHVAFYCAEMDLCSVGGIEVTPQAGAFYGGWITPNLTGTVKGAPGTQWW